MNNNPAYRILLLMPKFYGIEAEIKLSLEHLGYDVTWIENKSLTFDYHGVRSKLKILRRIYFLIFTPQIRYIDKQFKKNENSKFDLLIAINGFVVCSYLFKKLKKQNPDIHSVLYLWDSFSMFNWTRELKYFNKVLTFDKDDSVRYNIEYKPNFYIKPDLELGLEEKYDLFFVGKYSPDRLAMVDGILDSAENSGINSFIRLWPAYKILFHNSFVHWFLKKINCNSLWIKNYLNNYDVIEGIVKREYLVTESIDFKEVRYHFLCSNVILDLPFQRQTGYSHRLIEALANGKKVITTNAGIKNEEFFNAEQIHIINLQNPEIDFKWVKKRSNFSIDKYFQELELSKWLKLLINAEAA